MRLDAAKALGKSKVNVNDGIPLQILGARKMKNAIKCLKDVG